MELRARTRPLARRAGLTAALAALLVPAAAGTATADAAKRKAKKKYPVVTSVRPMTAQVGDTLTLHGRNFKRGRNKNTVVFKRDGARAVFVKTTTGTARQIRVQVPATLVPFLADGPARVRLRVLASRFGKRFTGNALSPTISAPPPGAAAPDGQAARPGGPAPAAPPPPPPAPKVCSGDEDNDLLSASLENELGLDACSADTDGDGVEDGYEYKSARDLNDDEYQDENKYLPYPGKRPYPNPLDKEDAKLDHDGDALTLTEEYSLWKKYGTRTLSQLYYSAGEAYSLSEREDVEGVRRPTQPAATYAKPGQFMAWAADNGYDPILLYHPDLSDPDPQPWHEPAHQALFSLLDFNRDGDVDSDPRPGYIGPEELFFDYDLDLYVSDDERDEDADGLTNFDEAHGRMLPSYWSQCYFIEKPYALAYKGTDLTDADTDGDGVRDGADDQDHDDIPNVMELSRNAASGHDDRDPARDGTCQPDPLLLQPNDNDPNTPDEALVVLHHENDFGRVNPFNPCLPFKTSRTCDRHPLVNGGSAPFDYSPNWLALQ